MKNSIWALALVGAAAYLFKTKKGAELRKNMMSGAGTLRQKMTDMYRNRRTGVDAIDAQMS